MQEGGRRYHYNIASLHSDLANRTRIRPYIPIVQKIT
jgi:hypothetical protein